ncbi:putative exportin 1, partial [Cardiosporidium cionae]
MSANITRCDPRILLDQNSPFDDTKVEVLDTVVKAMLSSADSQSRDVAHKVLGDFKNLPNAWRFVAIILQKSNDSNTKFFALQILENCIMTRWKILPETEKAGIKQYVSEMTLQLASNEAICQNEKHFINKVNENLIQIVKQEWPHNWPNFITELCKSSRTNQAICENNMRLLNLLSEEVFDFGRESMASKKVEYLMEQMTVQFQEVFDLCMFILQSYISNPNGIRNSLVRQTLQCLAHFLKWIPYGYIFEVYSCGNQQTNLIDLLLSYFWEPVNYRIECVKCLSEISNLVLDPSELREFQSRLSFLRNYRVSICETVEDTSDLFFLLKLMVSVLLVNMTYINHDETFKICLDYWNIFVETLMNEVQEAYAKERNLLSVPSAATTTVERSNGTLMEPLEKPENYSSRLKVYQWILDEVRSVVIQRMAKPQEKNVFFILIKNFLKISKMHEFNTRLISIFLQVYIQFDQETEEVTRDNEIDTDEIALYNEMRTILILLTNLGQDSTKRIMLEGLHVECLSPTHDASTWNPTLLNRLCYSIAAISGAMSEIVERDFLVVVIRKLLSLCEMKRGKEAKAIVASCIMHVVGQYSRFLKAHWRFLKTVAYKLFEFMHETFPGVQDMACETFLKITLKCKHVMAIQHP